MKKILWICSALLAMVSCQEDYELNTDFAVPTELSSPASIQLNVSSPTPVVLSWSGGGAADGGIVLYEVLFDKADGDFSKPLATVLHLRGRQSKPPPMTTALPTKKHRH